jgi:hypothetical protein
MIGMSHSLFRFVELLTIINLQKWPRTGIHEFLLGSYIVKLILQISHTFSNTEFF